MTSDDVAECPCSGGIVAQSHIRVSQVVIGNGGVFGDAARIICIKLGHSLTVIAFAQQSLAKRQIDFACYRIIIFGKCTGLFQQVDCFGAAAGVECAGAQRVKDVLFGF